MPIDDFAKQLHDKATRGIVLSAEEQALFDERQEARKQREFARADDARGRLEAMGVLLEDTPRGTRWRRKR